MGAKEASRELGESKKDFVVFIPFQIKTIKEILFPRIKRIVEMEVNILLKGNGKCSIVRQESGRSQTPMRQTRVEQLSN